MSASPWMWLVLYLWVVTMQTSQATKKPHSSAFGTDLRYGLNPPRAGMRAFGANSICAYCRHIGHAYCIYLYCYGGGQIGGAYSPYGGPFVSSYLPQPIPKPVTICYFCQMSNNQHCIRQYCTGTGQIGFGSTEGFDRFIGSGVTPILSPSRDIICAHCWDMYDFHCIRKYCSSGFGFAGGSVLNTRSFIAPISRLDPSCSYCQMIMDQQCISKFCAGLGRLGIGNAAGSFELQVSRRGPICAYCMRMNDQHCIRKYCRRLAVILPAQGSGVAYSDGNARVTAFRKKTKQIGTSSY